MKKIVTGVSILLASFSFSFAQSTVAGDIDPNVQAQSECITLSSAGLRLGARDSSTSGEVTMLQDFLNPKYLVSSASGYFGKGTLAAVKAFQSDNGLLNSGYVGPITRAKIHDVSCNGQVAVDSVTPRVSAASMSSVYGPIGTVVTISGSSFASDAKVIFEPQFTGNTSSVSGVTTFDTQSIFVSANLMRFTVPSVGKTPSGQIMCITTPCNQPTTDTAVTPGRYAISITSANGKVSVGSFRVVSVNTPLAVITQSSNSTTVGTPYVVSFVTSNVLSCNIIKTYPDGRTYNNGVGWPGRALILNTATPDSYTDNDTVAGTYSYELICKDATGMTIPASDNSPTRIIHTINAVNTSPTAALSESSTSGAPGVPHTVTWTTSNVTTCSITKTYPLTSGFSSYANWPGRTLILNRTTPDSFIDNDSGVGVYSYDLTCKDSSGVSIPSAQSHITYTINGANAVSDVVSTDCTPTMTINGQTGSQSNPVTLNVGDNLNRVYSNGCPVGIVIPDAAYTSTYKAEGTACSLSTSGFVPWGLSGASGNTSKQQEPEKAGCTYTLTYSFTQPNGVSKSVTNWGKINTINATNSANTVTTPLITSISPTSGKEADIITISGTKLNTVNSTNSIYFGDYLLSAFGGGTQSGQNPDTQTIITFKVPHTPLGTYQVKVKNTTGVSSNAMAFNVSSCGTPTTQVMCPNGQGMSYNATTCSWDSSSCTTATSVPQATPTVSVSLTNPGGLLVGTSAESKVGEFTVTAPASGRIGLKTVPVAFSYLGITNPSVDNVRVADGGTSITIASYSVNGSTVTINFTGASGFEIPQGTSKTFSVYGRVGGTVITGVEPKVTSRLTPRSAFSWYDVTANNTVRTGDIISSFPANSYLISAAAQTSSIPSATITHSINTNGAHVITWTTANVNSCFISKRYPNGGIYSNENGWPAPFLLFSPNTTQSFTEGDTGAGRYTYDISCTDRSNVSIPVTSAMHASYDVLSPDVVIAPQTPVPTAPAPVQRPTVSFSGSPTEGVGGVPHTVTWTTANILTPTSCSITKGYPSGAIYSNWPSPYLTFSPNATQSFTDGDAYPDTHPSFVIYTYTLTCTGADAPAVLSYKANSPCLLPNPTDPICARGAVSLNISSGAVLGAHASNVSFLGLEKGQVDKRVKSLKEALLTISPSISKGCINLNTENLTYGPTTEECVKVLQATNQLEVTGKIDQTTSDVINAILSR